MTSNTLKKSSPFADGEIIELAAKYPTPFHLYDEATIRNTCRSMKEAFAWAPSFKNYFAVKANPNPSILQIVKEEGMGADCSSLAELLLAEAVGMKNEDIMFTSNNTPLNEFAKACKLGAIINLDDVSHLEFLHQHLGLPELLSARFNPGPARVGNVIIGDPVSAKFGLTTDQVPELFQRAQKLGVKRFALHTMVVSNSLSEDELAETGQMMFELTVKLKKELNIKLEFVNLGGGIGIPYRPEDQGVDIAKVGERIKELYNKILIPNGLENLGIAYECGRFVTGPAGVLVSRIIHQKNIYKKYLGIDASINSLMRPALYGAYHHITPICDENANVLAALPKTRSLFPEAPEDELCDFDVVGGLCENNDKLATDRPLPACTRIGDILVFHDTGAHGHCMGFNYNGKLRVAEYLKKDARNVKKCCFTAVACRPGRSKESSVVCRIRRAETYNDLFSSIVWCGGLPGKTFWDSQYVRYTTMFLIGLTSGFAAIRMLMSKKQSSA